LGTSEDRKVKFSMHTDREEHKRKNAKLGQVEFSGITWPTFWILRPLHISGDISFASKTAKITVFDPVNFKTLDAPLQDELLYRTCVVYGYFYWLFFNATFKPF